MHADTKASQQRIEALRRKLSNQANGEAPSHSVPGAPFIAQSAGTFTAGNVEVPVAPAATPAAPAATPAATPLVSLEETPKDTLEVPHGRYHPRTHVDDMAPVASPATPNTIPGVVETAPTPSGEVVETPATQPVRGLADTPPAVVGAPSPGEDDLGLDSISNAQLEVEMPPPPNPYWKFLG